MNSAHAYAELIAHAYAELIALPAATSPAAYRGAQDFLLKHGREFEPLESLPKGLRRGIPKACYYNCYTISRRRGTRYAYAEGFAVPHGLLPIAHAWLVDRQTGKAVEVTLREPAAAYFGATFTASALAEARIMNGCYSILFAWMGEHFNQLMEGSIKAEDILEDQWSKQLLSHGPANELRP